MSFFKNFLENFKRKPLFYGSVFGGFIIVCAGIVLFIHMLGIDNELKPKLDGEFSAPGGEAVSVIVDETNVNRVLDISSLLTSVTAEKTTGRVIETDSAFRITTAEIITAARLKPLLTLEPALNFEVVEISGNEFQLIVSETLPEDSIVRLALLDDDGEVERRWAFQTAPVFKINHTLPGNEGEHVPVNTGIEINFSAEVNPAIMQNYFSIEPEVSGRFERFRNTVVFVPDSKLAENTVYTVHIKAGLPSADGFELAQDLTFSFRTYQEWDSNFFRAGGKISETFIPGDPVVLEIYCSQPLGSLTYEVELFEFGDTASYRAALDNFIQGSSWQRDLIISTENLTNVYSSAVQLLRAEDDKSRSWGWRPSYILLPDNLAEGYYLATVETELDGTAYSAQKLIQINSVSVYASSLPNESIFFINDTATRLPLSAEVQFGGDVSVPARTDANGIARVEVSAETSGRSVLSIESVGHLPFVDLFDIRARTERTPEENYFLHLYTDRETYKTTDEIFVWGVVIPRERGIPMPADLYLQAGEETENRPIPITLAADGTFTAVINLQNNAESWWYAISLMTGDEIMARKRITIRDYVKPSYVFDIDVPFYAWLPHINPVDVSLSASFFEGTPAKDLDFTVYSWEAVEQETALVTNEAGYVETSLLFTNEYRDTWRPLSLYPVFSLSGIENEYQRKTGMIWGLFRDVMLETDYDSDTGTLNITTSLVDPTSFVPQEHTDNTSYYGVNFNNWRWGWGGWYWEAPGRFTDILRGAAADVTVTATLNRSWTEQIETGSYYDFIQKRNITSYRYENREETVGTYTVNTVNGTGAFANLPVHIEGSWYSLELEWFDTRGERVAETVYLYDRNRWGWWGDTSVHNYNLVAERNFTENQELQFVLENNGEPVDSIPEDARIFYVVSGSEIITSGIESAPAFSHMMTADYIPNVNISGAYFNGRHVFPLAINQYFFDSSEREIIIEISTDKDSYRPAETASVTVTARDLQGRVVPDARVSLSAVDEAAFAVQDQRINTLR
ncbi:MAG: Ig-like domain-containing protein, partial [Oscillospiraceae bacterium]|nr:Ig-like domain-containing protein [Oscillospiraceae bacterium]